MNCSSPGGVPDEAANLADIAQQALMRRDVAAAQVLLERFGELQPANPQPWLHLAMLFRTLKDEPREELALAGALRADPQDLIALLMRGHLLERQGYHHLASTAYQGAVAVAPPVGKLVPELRPGLQRAIEFCDAYNKAYGDFVDRFMAERCGDLSGRELDRLRLSLDIQFGRKKRYDAQPVGYFFPGLRPIEFFPRADFPWLDEIEARTDAIRDEFLAVLRAENGFTPYITYSQDQPLNQWAELNDSPRWSAFHLIKDGHPVDANAARCPGTMQALSAAPQPHQAGRTPVAMFSLLKPLTRIPPHTGISNARLVVHLPLIVPEGCGFRVGNETRGWVPGKAWVFDDTIEHEAWNDSSKLRVLLIFDIWHPELTLVERAAVSALSEAQNIYFARADGFGVKGVG